jgi:predicted N-acetyltransferase YhbS
MEPIIRLMKKKDIEEISILYANVYDSVDIGEKRTKETASNLMNYRLSRQPDLCFIATIDEKIVGGFIAGIKPWWDGNHLVDGEVFVDYAYHKQKIGSKLSKVIYQTALDKYSITSIDLVTFSKN